MRVCVRVRVALVEVVVVTVAVVAGVTAMCIDSGIGKLDWITRPTIQ